MAGIVAFSILSLILVIYTIVILVKNNSNPYHRGKIICEIIFVLILPPIGIHITNDKCGEHPFQNDSLPTAYLLWSVFMIAYFVSRFFKGQLPPIPLLVVSTSLFCGFIYCLTLTIHFAPFMAAVIFPFYGLLLITPVLCLLFIVLEIISLNRYFRSRFEAMGINTENKDLGVFYNYLSKYNLAYSVYLTAPLLLILQAILYLFGQAPDSVISQFTESCGFLLSKHQDCSCGGDHYLCSVAANGNKKLVRPVRFGIRQDQKIIVNRQLLIANAFENWLEDHTPKLHQRIRKTYDSMGIPVNKWAKNKKLANVIYVLMKPLEWLFLGWLYCTDKRPENRIGVQYIPKIYLTNLKTTQHERN